MDTYPSLSFIVKKKESRSLDSYDPLLFFHVFFKNERKKGIGEGYKGGWLDEVLLRVSLGRRAYERRCLHTRSYSNRSLLVWRRSRQIDIIQLMGPTPTPLS